MNYVILFLMLTRGRKALWVSLKFSNQSKLKRREKCFWRLNKVKLKITGIIKHKETNSIRVEIDIVV